MSVSILEGSPIKRIAAAMENMAVAMSKDVDITSFNQIEAIAQMGLARKYFGIGDQIVVKWKPDNDGTAEYDLPWDVVHIGDVTDPSGEVHKDAIYLESHYALLGVQFDGNEAFYVPSAAMPAGTYHFTMGNAWGSNVVKDKVYQFTTTKEIPANGQLVLGTASNNTSGLPDQNPANWRVRTYKTGIQTDPDEILTLTEGSEGTDLGTLSSSQKYSENGINNMQRAAYGYNRWAHSAMRQYLNSGAGKGDWWTQKNPFDHRPDQLASMQGFMAGLPEDFLRVIKPIKVVTALNTVSDSEIGTTEETNDRFFCAGLQQEFIAPQLANVEGETWDYWKERLNNKQHGQGVVRAEHIRYAIENHTSAQYVRLRSANRGLACNTWAVSASGYAGSFSSATYATRPAPACVIY